MATHSSILAWKIPWTEEPGGLQSMGWQESDMAWRLNHHHISTHVLQLLKDTGIRQIETKMSAL